MRPRLLLAIALCAATVTAPPVRAETGYVPLWPFVSEAEASGAQQQQWNADPAATALRFTRDFLGFTEMDRITGIELQDDQAWIGVGAGLPDGRPWTAATVHLIRFGARGAWEVVGTRDGVLTLDQPVYGATVGSVFDAGGTITGVDESLQVQVRQVGRPSVVGEFCCLPGGGQQTPWSVRVPADGASPGPATVVVSTGGHVAAVEVFAITGVVVG